MRKNIIYYVIAILAIQLFSCETVVDSAKLIPNGNKLVVNSIISPDLDIIEVEVSRSIPVIGTNRPYYSDEDIMKNATVTISDESVSKQLSFNHETKKYQLFTNEMPIVEGGTYTLTVLSENETVNAQCTVPKRLNYDVIFAQDFPNERGINFNVSWDNTPEEVNYYHITYYYDVVDNFSSFNYYNQHFIDDSDGSDEQFTILDFLDYEKLTTSASRNLQLTVYSVDEHYYGYQKLLQIIDDENPFVEPVQLPTNIEGGLGLFGAYVRTDRNFTLN